MPVATLAYHSPTDSYRSSCGYSMARESDTLTPNGNRMNGRWVLRDPEGGLVDFCRYRNDLAENNDMKLVGGG